jgi:hypothetical protein
MAPLDADAIARHSSGALSPDDQMDDKRDDGEEQKQVDQSADNMKKHEGANPRNQQQDGSEKKEELHGEDLLCMQLTIFSF